MLLRVSRKAQLDLSGDLPSFLESTTHIRRDLNWRVLPVPPRLQRRHVDIGDLAPCDTQRFIKALQSPAQGIQVPPQFFTSGHNLISVCQLLCPMEHGKFKSSLWFRQVDFDDGNCPTYYNQIKGIHNIVKVVHNQFPSRCLIYIFICIAPSHGRENL